MIMNVQKLVLAARVFHNAGGVEAAALVTSSPSPDGRSRSLLRRGRNFAPGAPPVPAPPHADVEFKNGIPEGPGRGRLRSPAVAPAPAFLEAVHQERIGDEGAANSLNSTSQLLEVRGQQQQQIKFSMLGIAMPPPQGGCGCGWNWEGCNNPDQSCCWAVCCPKPQPWLAWTNPVCARQCQGHWGPWSKCADSKQTRDWVMTYLGQFGTYGISPKLYGGGPAMPCVGQFAVDRKQTQDCVMPTTTSTTTTSTTTTSSTTSTTTLPPATTLAPTTTSTTTSAPKKAKPKPIKPCCRLVYLLPIAFLALFATGCCCYEWLAALAAAPARGRTGRDSFGGGEQAGAEVNLVDDDPDPDAEYLAEQEKLLNPPPPSPDPQQDENEPWTWQAPPPGALDSAHNAVSMANEAAEELVDDPAQNASTLMSAGFSPEYAQEVADAISKIPRDADNPTPGASRRRRRLNPRRGPTARAGRQMPPPHRDRDGRGHDTDTSGGRQQPTGPQNDPPDGESPRGDFFHIFAPAGGGDEGAPGGGDRSPPSDESDKGAPSTGPGERAAPAHNPGARYKRRKDNKNKDASKMEEAGPSRKPETGPGGVAGPIMSFGIDYPMPLPKNEKDLALLQSFGLWTPAKTPPRKRKGGKRGDSGGRSRGKKKKKAPTRGGASDAASASASPTSPDDASDTGGSKKNGATSATESNSSEDDKNKKTKKAKANPKAKSLRTKLRPPLGKKVAKKKTGKKGGGGGDVTDDGATSGGTSEQEYNTTATSDSSDADSDKSKERTGTDSGFKHARQKMEGKKQAAGKKKGGAKKKKGGGTSSERDDAGTSSSGRNDESSDDGADGPRSLMDAVHPGEMGDAENVRDFLMKQWKKQMYNDDGVKSLLEGQQPEISGVLTTGEVEKALVDSGFSKKAAKLIAPLAQAHGTLEDTPPRREKDGTVVQPKFGEKERMKKVAVPAAHLKDFPVEKLDPEDRERFWNNFRVALLPPATGALEAARKRAGFQSKAAKITKSKVKQATKSNKLESLLENSDEKDVSDRRAVEMAQIVRRKCRSTHKPPPKDKAAPGGSKQTHSPGRDDAPEHYLDTAEVEKVLQTQGFSKGIARKLAKFFDDQLQERAKLEGRAAKIALDFLQKGGTDELTLQDTLPRCAENILKQMAKEEGTDTKSKMKKDGTSKKGKDATPASPLQLTKEDAERIGTKALAEWKLRAEVDQFVRQKEPADAFDVVKGFDAAAAAGMSYELADALTADDLDEILEAGGGAAAADGGAEKIKEFLGSNFMRQNLVGRSSTSTGAGTSQGPLERQVLVLGEIMKPSHVRSFVSAGVAQSVSDKLPRLLAGQGTSGGGKKPAADAAELAAEFERSLDRCGVFDAEAGGYDKRKAARAAANAAMRKKIAEKLAGHLVKRAGGDAGATERICFNENGPLAAAVLANSVPGANKSGASSSSGISAPSTMTHLGPKSSPLTSSLTSSLLTPGVEYQDSHGTTFVTHVAQLLPGFALSDAHLRELAKSGATEKEMKMLTGFRGKEEDYVVVKEDEKLVDPEMASQLYPGGAADPLHAGTKSALQSSRPSLASSATNRNLAGENYLSSKAGVIEKANLVQNFQARAKKNRLDQVKEEMKKKKPTLAKTLASQAKAMTSRGPQSAAAPTSAAWSNGKSKH